jgi:hypothetical protein
MQRRASCIVTTSPTFSLQGVKVLCETERIFAPYRIASYFVPLHHPVLQGIACAGYFNELSSGFRTEPEPNGSHACWYDSHPFQVSSLTLAMPNSFSSRTFIETPAATRPPFACCDLFIPSSGYHQHLRKSVDRYRRCLCLAVRRTRSQRRPAPLSA